MKTLLIPVDFTPTSANAISYATAWVKAFGYTRIILLKTFYDSMFETIVQAAEYMRVNQDYMSREREEATEKLEVLYAELKAKVDEQTEVKLIVSEEPLLRAILYTVENENPELLVVGSDNSNYSSNSYIAGNVISIAKISPVRVLIVPSHYQYQVVHQALVPCDFNTVASLIKLQSYQASSTLWKDKKLLILNVDPKETYLNPDKRFLETEEAMHHYLEHFNHEVFYSNNKNIINGILQFSNHHEIQLIIALPGKHSFLYSLTHSSISQALYKNTSKPVLILK